MIKIGNFRPAALFFMAASLIVTAVPADAAPLVVTSYDLPNGDGQASGGTYNYWDVQYTGSGSTTTDGAALTGGTGKLTDGIISTQRWDNVSNNAGTGQYVGWYGPRTLNPLLTFHLAGAPVVDSISIQLDNSGFGGVFAPLAIKIDGLLRSFTAPALGTVGVVTFSSLNLAGSTHTVEFDQQANTWTFVSEVQFAGVASAVPEASTWAMMLAGFAGLGFVAYRRRRAVNI